MKHRGCGGEIAEDLDSPPYLYEGMVISVYRCVKCGEEILGDADIELDEEDHIIPR